ncbi:MAG: RNA pyrophosphohydrolase [Gammaproteobacteria bacterium]|nr:RNA pyrophosphohydrolase [Gammaproteobacteria bacterium]
MIDNDGYRLNVGIIICNDENQLFWGKRVGQESWQFPQGGIADYESSQQTLIRELYEETGLAEDDIEILAEMPEWIHYDLPENLIRRYKKPVCIGQKQKWYLVRLINSEDHISLKSCERPEFDSWKWVDYWKPLDDVIFFKREVYKKALTEFAPLLDPALLP